MERHPAAQQQGAEGADRRGVVTLKRMSWGGGAVTRNFSIFLQWLARGSPEPSCGANSSMSALRGCTTTLAAPRGAGGPLLLVHGFPTSSFLWSRVVPLVPAGYGVVAYRICSVLGAAIPRSSGPLGPT